MFLLFAAAKKKRLSRDTQENVQKTTSALSWQAVKLLAEPSKKKFQPPYTLA